MTDTLPVRHNINSFPDTPVHRVFRWLADGTPKNLTGWTGRLRIGLNGQFLKEVPGAITISGVDGTATLDIPVGTLTAVGLYWYVVDLLDPLSVPTRFVNGSLRMSEVYQ